MFIPLGDGKGLQVIPFQLVTAGLIALNVIIWLAQISQPDGAAGAGRMVATYGFTPSALFAAAGANGLLQGLVGDWQSGTPPIWFTLISSQFLHGGFWHLSANMLFLWVFGASIEDAMGHRRYLGFYLLCGIAACLTHGVANPDSSIPMIGASGAISGVLAAYLMLHPRVRVLILALNWIPMRIPVWIIIGLWTGWQFYELGWGKDTGTAWLAHIGGLVTGLCLTPFFKRQEVPLFDRAPLRDAHAIVGEIRAARPRRGSVPDAGESPPVPPRLKGPWG